MTPASANLLPETGAAPEFVDGFGTRLRLLDAAGSEPLDMLRLSETLVAAPGFDFALRERVSRLTNFRHAYYARVRRVDRAGETLALVSDAQPGARLSRVLQIAHEHDLDLDVNAALCLLRQIVPAVAMLHQNARDVSHGAIAPERIVVTSNARVVLVEYVLGAAVESLGFSRDRLWKELRVAVPPGAGTPRLSHRVDVMQIGVVALALVLGRPLGDGELRDLSALVASATENSVMGGRQPISDPLRRWLSRALQLDSRGSFESALEAQLALDDVLSGEAGYIAAPVALESFLAQYEECAARVAARRDATAAPGQAPAAGVPAVQARAPEPPVDNTNAAPARVTVPPPTPKLGVAKLSDDAPAVPSFRAAAAQPSQQTPPQPAPVPAVEPPRAIAPPSARPAVESVAAPQPSLVTTPLAVPVEPRADARRASDEPAGEDGHFDEGALRAQFLAASGQPDDAGERGGPGKWRLAAIALALVAIAEGAFIGWTVMGGGGALVGDRGTLKVDSKPAGAQVKVDGEIKGTTPLSLPLGAGAHVVEITAGAEPRVIPITIGGGETLSQYIELAGDATLGRLSIQSSPAGATVLVDGQIRGVTPLELPDVAAGEHEVVLDLSGQRVRQAVTVAGGVTTTVNVPMTGGVAAPPAQEQLAAGMVPAAPAVGQLIVQVPFEMQVFENGAQLGLTSSRLALPPGSHELEIVSETLAFRTRARVNITAGRTARLPITLPKGVVHLNATPWAEVWIDGEKVGETPIGNLPVTIGPHEIRFRHPELGEQAHAATVTAAAPVRLSVDLTKKP